MNTQANGARPQPHVLDMRLDTLWTDSVIWVTQHTVQIVIGLIIGAIVVSILLGAKWIGRRLSKNYANHNHWPRIIGGALSKIRLWFVAAVALHVISNYAHAPDDLAKTVHFLFVIAATLQGAVFIREIILGLVEYRAASADGHVALSSALGIIRLLVTVVLFAVAMILILSNLGVNVTGLIAGLGVGGIAIGLAAQGIFADLFAALAILFDRPFRKGDAIRVDAMQGTVEDIGLKSTRIRALTGEQVILANKQLLEKEIHNLARLDRRRIVRTLGLTYQTRVEMLEQLPIILRGIVETCDNVTLVRCGLVNFGDSTLDVELQYDVHSEDYEVVFAAQHQVNIAILRRFAELGIEFAYPTQTAFTAAPDGTYILPYADPLKPDVVQR
jgi:small-conductance mechanosensitive channel